MPKYRPYRRRMSKSMKVRVSRLESKIKQIKPEAKRLLVKDTGAATVDPSNNFVASIAKCQRGVAPNQRTGNKIRIFQVEAKWYCANEYVEVFLIMSRNGEAPLQSDFSYNPGCNHVGSNASYNYKVLRSWQGAYIPSRKTGRFLHRWRGGHLQVFDQNGSVDWTGWTPYLVFVNGESVAVSIKYQIEMRFTDV